jgi:endoglucanase
MDIANAIKLLSDETGVSGEESKAAKLAASMLKEYTNDVCIKNGNVIGKLGKHDGNSVKLVLDAHIDQVGLIVTYVDENGFIKAANCGGIDRRLLPAQQVIIHGKRDIYGIVISIPPHLSGGKEKEVPEISELCIDTGMGREELLEIVQPGDKITFDVKCGKLLGRRIAGRALDDRAGVAAILYALDLLKNEEINCALTVLFSAQEEIGERGAKIAAYDINADIAIAVDVGFGYAEGEKEEKCGKLGNGGMIGISPSLDKKLSLELIDIAKEMNIPFQHEIMPGLTSTNADQFSVSGSGARAVTLSIPLRYMHTPVEVVDLSDVENVGKLLAEYIRRTK